jgi:hypothetical protein
MRLACRLQCSRVGGEAMKKLLIAALLLATPAAWAAAPTLTRAQKQTIRTEIRQTLLQMHGREGFVSVPKISPRAKMRFTIDAPSPVNIDGQGSYLVRIKGIGMLGGEYDAKTGKAVSGHQMGGGDAD